MAIFHVRHVENDDEAVVATVEFVYNPQDIDGTLQKIVELTTHTDSMDWWNNPAVTIYSATPNYRSTRIGDYIFHQATGRFWRVDGPGIFSRL